MESNKFDALARRAVGEDSSRRGVLRAGISALAGSALAVVGLRAADDAVADKKKNGNDKDNHRKDKQFKRQHRRVAVCYFGETLEVKKQGFASRFPGATLGACVCQAPFVSTCGNGCCPAEFPQCCSSGAAGGERGQTAGDVCAPNTSRCCPVSQGGGACDNPNPQCCPPTNQAPLGSCAPVDAACCGNNTGGGVCEAPFNNCCPAIVPARGGGQPCCRPTERCCNNPGATGQAAVTAGCLAGQVCNNGCCTANFDVVTGFRNGGGGVRTEGASGGGPGRSSGAAKVGIAPV